MRAINLILKEVRHCSPRPCCNDRQVLVAEICGSAAEQDRSGGSTPTAPGVDCPVDPRVSTPPTQSGRLVAALSPA